MSDTDKTLETLIKIHRAIEDNDGPIIAKDVNKTAADMARLEVAGLIEKPKSEPTRRIEGRRGRPAFQYRLTKKAKDRVKRYLAKQEKASATVEKPAEVEIKESVEQVTA